MGSCQFTNEMSIYERAIQHRDSGVMALTTRIKVDTLVEARELVTIHFVPARMLYRPVVAHLHLRPVHGLPDLQALPPLNRTAFPSRISWDARAGSKSMRAL